jgi:hypothetical protein
MAPVELYLYWKTDVARADGAEAAARGWQQALCQEHPALQARLLRRADADASPARTVTLMEIYRRPGGIDAALQATIVETGAQRLAVWLLGPRHVEAFTPID